MNKKIAIIGLGYVGLPLAIEFGKKYETYGFDINQNRIDELNKGIDITGEASKRNIQSSIKLTFTSNSDEISKCNIFIISVPTPIDNNNRPDLGILFNATKLVGNLLKNNDLVIYESTVYPGCTEEDCVPILEKESKLKYNKDFFCGYSPERINPGDKTKTLSKITKITSGSNEKIAKKVDKLYLSIIKAGTYPVSSIKIAESAKIIENCQRDINIAFVNELAMLFNKLDIDSNEVLEAAGSKWNFLPFKPGLVGGHCIGVDPYYLTYKANQVNYDSKIILAGRKLNNSIPGFICNKVIEHCKNKRFKKPNILILGITFKENCSDTRNSKVFDLYNFLKKEDYYIDAYDPYVNKEDVDQSIINLINYNEIKKNFYHSIIIAVEHNQFQNMEITQFQVSDDCLVFDIKGMFNNKKYMRL